jgi:hypothetical protein
VHVIDLCLYPFPDILVAFDPNVSAIIWEHGGQLKHLEIFNFCEADEEDRDGIIDIFDETTPGPLSLLETLTVGKSDEKRFFVGPQILLLLPLAPNIVNCIFSGIQWWKDLDVASETLVLPTLCRFNLVWKPRGLS